MGSAVKDCFTLQPSCKQTPPPPPTTTPFPEGRHYLSEEKQRERRRHCCSDKQRVSFTTTYKSSSPLRRRSEASSRRIVSSCCLHLYRSHTGGASGGCSSFRLSLLLDDVFCAQDSLRRLKSRGYKADSHNNNKKNNTSFKIAFYFINLHPYLNVKLSIDSYDAATLLLLLLSHLQ